MNLDLLEFYLMGKAYFGKEGAETSDTWYI
jgi:hypothetical protein